jgi:hypothetical protein
MGRRLSTRRGGGRGTAHSRREFLRLIATGAAAAVAAPAGALAAETRKKPAAKKRAAKPPVKTEGPKPHVSPSGHVAEAAEIEKQKVWLAEALKVLREYPLPPGSEMGFSFRPLASRRRTGR